MLIDFAEIWWLVYNFNSQCCCRISLKSDVVCQSYGNVYSVIAFSWTRCTYLLTYLLFPLWSQTTIILLRGQMSPDLHHVADDDDFGAWVAERHHGVVRLAATEDSPECPQRRPAYDVADRSTDEHIERSEQPVTDCVGRRVPTNIRTVVSQPRR